jgi:hypothetical protein
MSDMLEIDPLTARHLVKMSGQQARMVMERLRAEHGADIEVQDALDVVLGALHEAREWYDYEPMLRRNAPPWYFVASQLEEQK